MNRWKRNLASAASLSLAVSTTALAAMAAQGAFRAYYVNDPVGRNVVVIESRAPLETMITRTNAVTATIGGDPADIFKTGSARFEVDLTQLDTGIAQRNEHMRGAAWLNTAKYPKAIFNLTRLVQLDKMMNSTLTEGVTRPVIAEGTLELHGQTKPIAAKLELTSMAANDNTKTRLDGDLLHIRGTFDIKLSDFGIIAMKGAELKVADQESVTVDVFASTGSKDPFAAPKPVTELIKEDLKVGDGAEAKAGQSVTVNYRGTLMDGTIFDESYKRGEPFTFNLGAGQVIKGWDLGVAGMKIGGKRRLTIPSKLAYGSRGAGDVIPPDAPLIFEVELLAVK